MSRALFIISGATATGKSDLAIALAQLITKKHQAPTEIVNFDSLLFYRELTIGTAKPTPEQLAETPHHMIDLCSIRSPLNASAYCDIATEIIQQLHHEGKIIILVGGSAFYLRALIKGMYHSPAISLEIRQRSNELLQNEGITPFQSILKEHDPDSFNSLHSNDHYRIVRAVEYWWASGTPISDERKKFTKLDPYDFSKNIHPEWNIQHFYLTLSKEWHSEIIYKRAARMIEQGLQQEVEELLAQGFTGKEKPLQSIGYKETLQYISNQFNNPQEYLERIAISTRQLAKSQRTFFNKITPKVTIEIPGGEYCPAESAAKILESSNLSF
ncbi:MAG: tRNA (adenosine(37)-N6)-dimethylallyltransferase MiaA [Bdellovibrionales bacterium]|nr:tRNA (adenosine(37)-N6)-dimethylallyltransferase MiaA [Bdellovibrionales bacterium]MBT3525625.1 tRNA (adenosine(37)-N6)-dimethylallyltransferase MiaA [Bdellovibrionales bacterium]MBT7766343.1 tRNA (adenosine(37)-N6)-dimethylallyltransferase MiaA [Bdellovibrionales bacterium]